MAYSFFLYGIYAEGQKCFSRFKNLVSHSRPAYVKGTMNKLTCGLPILSTPGDQMIPGQLVELNIPESYWPILDALNGYNASNLKKSFLVREAVEVILMEGPSVSAQTYCLNAARSSHVAELLSSESWESVVESSTNLVEKLTERQKTYLQKLSQAKGREIIPVDMALYRELMSLELIIDKGRRIALTRLGLEISHFL
jgi:gamma-glutamylcyclotransferase (GGCT)/AIG2-like uncharacterized protein YtfP